MAIEYDGAVFDTVEELVKYKAMVGDLEVIEDAEVVDEETTRQFLAQEEELPEEEEKPTANKYNRQLVELMMDFAKRHSVNGYLKKGKIQELAASIDRPEEEIKFVLQSLVEKGLLDIKLKKPRRKKNAKKNKPWTKEDDKLLISERKKYVMPSGILARGSLGKMSKLLGRTPGAISVRLAEFKNKGLI